MTDPVVDIIILSLNRADDTIAAIASSLDQEGIASKIWVLDQGSDRDDLDKLERFCAGTPVHLEKRSENLGVAGGRNRVTALGRAPYIIALDNDAVFADRHMVKRAVSYLQANDDLAAIGFQIRNYTTRLNDLYSWGYPKAILDRWEEEFDTTKFVGAGHAIVRKHFEAVGGYDDRLFFCWEEFDLCFRFINSGLGIRYVPSIKVFHKVSPELRVSWTGGRYYYQVRNALYIQSKYGTRLPIVVMMAAGYLVKGAYNGLAGESLRAIRDAFRMARDFKRQPNDERLYTLTSAARAYIAHHDTKLRGSLRRRIWTEVLAKLPG